MKQHRVNDVATAVVVAGSFLPSLPIVVQVLAAVLGAVYYAICIWESATVRRWFGRGKQ